MHRLGPEIEWLALSWTLHPTSHAVRLPAFAAASSFAVKNKPWRHSHGLFVLESEPWRGATDLKSSRDYSQKLNVHWSCASVPYLLFDLSGGWHERRQVWLPLRETPSYRPYAIWTELEMSCHRLENDTVIAQSWMQVRELQNERDWQAPKPID